MTIFEALSLLVAFLALIISSITAYITLLSKFKGEIFARPRPILTQLDGKALIVIGCDISNHGSDSGSIDDIVLSVKYNSYDKRVVDTYTFYPLIMRDSFSIYQNYTRGDFEPFQAIAIPARSRVTKYVAFVPGTETFSPGAGFYKLKLSLRYYNGRKWHSVKNGEMTLEVDDELSNSWLTPSSPSYMKETEENAKLRQDFLESGSPF
ncbi:MAG: hypothetical protein AAFY11_09755 [Cyanobacteria bacterium J06641_5]